MLGNGLWCSHLCGKQALETLPSAPCIHGVSIPPIPIAVTQAANLLTPGLALKQLWERTSCHGLYP